MASRAPLPSALSPNEQLLYFISLKFIIDLNNGKPRLSHKFPGELRVLGAARWPLCSHSAATLQPAGSGRGRGRGRAGSGRGGGGAKPRPRVSGGRGRSWWSEPGRWSLVLLLRDPSFLACGQTVPTSQQVELGPADVPVPQAGPSYLAMGLPLGFSGSLRAPHLRSILNKESDRQLFPDCWGWAASLSRGLGTDPWLLASALPSPTGSASPGSSLAWRPVGPAHVRALRSPGCC